MYLLDSCICGSGSYDVTCRCSYSFCWNVGVMKREKRKWVNFRVNFNSGLIKIGFISIRVALIFWVGLI
jgi:hypothetical protein